jgi:beta-lactamase class D
VFREAGVDGAFVLLDLGSGETTVVHPELASRGFLPASTFKIPNTLIGIETGVITDARFSLPWDGVRREFVAEWNRDHDLESAMKHSVLWFYQEIARRVGEERYRTWLERLDYGNHDTSGGVDRFWIEGGLRVTPREQVAFLTRMLGGELPVSERSVEILRGILPSATAGDVRLLAKTGLTLQGPDEVGWLVGFVERGSPTHVFAAVLTAPHGEDWSESPVLRGRKEVALSLLRRMGAVPQEMAPPR